MASQIMLAGMKISITGTPISHEIYFMIVMLPATAGGQ